MLHLKLMASGQRKLQKAPGIIHSKDTLPEQPPTKG
jgi:hypothetical protein